MDLVRSKRKKPKDAFDEFTLKRFGMMYDEVIEGKKKKKR